MLQTRDRYKDYTEIYTDGSKSNKEVGTAVIYQDTVIMLRLPKIVGYALVPEVVIYQ